MKKQLTCPFCHKDTAEVTMEARYGTLKFCRSCRKSWVTRYNTGRLPIS